MRVDDLEQLTKFHDKLNPDLWENNRLKPEVSLALFKIAREFIKFINVEDIKLTDITVSGSNASFNYTPVSDIDLHLIADVNGPCEVNIKEMFLAKKSAFNDQHDISIFGHSVEVYVQNSDEKHISNGIYSVYDDNWIKFPKKITAQPDISNIEDKFEYLHNEIDQAVDSGDRETIERLKKKIKTMRQSGLDKDGEYGVDNLAFKLLRNEGDIEKLYKAGTEATDTELSLSQQGVAEGLDQDIPSVLYHATYKPRLKSIQSKGLGSGGKRNWEDSQRGVVYLALDPDVAESYAETSDMVPDEWLDQIVMLKISTAGLDPNKFGIDSNVQDNAGDTIEYHGVIPVSNISLYKQGVAEGNAFLGALNTARKNNLEYFIVDGKKYKVKKNKKIVKEEELTEKWSKKYKRSIDCSHPKGFSQKAHCAGRKKK